MRGGGVGDLGPIWTRIRGFSDFRLPRGFPMQWPSLYQERSGTMTREKRGLEPISGDGMAQEPKRQKVPGLARFLSVFMLLRPFSSFSSLFLLVVSFFWIDHQFCKIIFPTALLRPHSFVILFITDRLTWR